MVKNVIKGIASKLKIDITL